MSISRARTLSIIRHLSANRQVKRTRKMPRPESTDPIEREYLNALLPMVDELRREVDRVLPQIVKDLEEQRRQAGHTDAVKKKRRPLDPRDALRLIKDAADRFASRFRPDALHAVVEKFGRRTDKHARRQLDRQVRAAIGVEYASIERPVRDLVPTWTTENVKLITTVPPRYFTGIARDVEKAYADGQSGETLTKAFHARHGGARYNAERIARTEVSKLNGRIAKERQTSIGVTGYTWETVHDSRVRECHQELQGTAQSWDDPPEGGGTDEDEKGEPGSGINCRCFAAPDLDSLING